MATLSLTNSADTDILFFEASFGDLERVNESVDFSALPAASRQHIIRVGLTNILRDSMAGKAGDHVEARQALVDKLQRVLSGDVSGATRGPRKDQETRCREAYLDDVIAKHCKAKGVAMLKGKALADARDNVYSRNAKAVDAEVKRRMRASDVEVELDLPA